MKKRRIFVSMLTGVGLGFLVTSQFIAPVLAQSAGDNAKVYQQLDLFGDVFERVRREYVEEVDEEKLIEAAINGMLQSLDPHSGYMPPEDAQEMRMDTRGEFGGLGMEVTQEDGFVKVVAPMDDTPAANAGIEAGDFITHVNDMSLRGMTLQEAVENLRGPIGSEVVITIMREGEAEPFNVTLVRDAIKLTAVRARSEGDAIVVRITTFSDQTYGNLESSIKKEVEARGGMDNVSGFVIDLRNNPGGLLEQAILVTDAFLDRGEIVSTRDRNGRGDRANAKQGDVTEGKPIVVLINEGSASASEIVAGALQDHRRAIVVGTRSFGKGSVQTLMPVPGNGAMRLTTARYYTPSGRSIQGLGVSPNVVVEQPRRDPNAPPPGSEEDEDSPATRTESSLRGSLDNDSLSEEEIKTIEAEREKARESAKLRELDYQLAYAVDMITGLAAVSAE